MSSIPSLTAFDLFCGAGGMSIGLMSAGFHIVGALDNFSPAIKTYRGNLGDHAQLEEISNSTNIPSCALIVGGPPCQGFSSAGLRRKDDHRNTLVSVFSSLIRNALPKAFIFENVEGFLTADGGDRVRELLEPLIEVGYRIHLRKINAANFGVPQHRKRVIAVGGLRWDPPFIEATHSAFGAPGATLGGRHLPRAATLAEAIASLPPASTNGDVDGISDHSHLPLKPEDLSRAMLMKQGQRMRDLPEKYWHTSYRRRAYRRVMDGTPTERRGGAPAGLRRLHADEPSKAITSGARTEFLHPHEHRNLTLRECARLQTFPDSFRFTGTLSERAVLIGNAVPPVLAEQLGLSLLDAFRTAKHENSFEQGRLLSFVPTLSGGMSPALKHTCDMVKDLFCSHEQVEQLSLWH